MRSIASMVNTQDNTATGTEPVIVILMQPNPFTILAFADKDGDYGGYHCTGRITDLGQLISQVRLGQLGTTSNVSCKLSDYDGRLKQLVDFTQLEGKQLSVYQTYQGLGSMSLLFRGVMTNPVWMEGSRELSVTAQSTSIHKLVGYHMEPDVFPGGNPDAFGKPWPIVFGKAGHCPALHIRKHTAGQLQDALSLAGQLYSSTATSLSLVDADGVYSLNGTTNPLKSFVVKGGLAFPQNKKIQLIVDNMCVFSGQFNDSETFHIDQLNMPKFSSVPCASRTATSAQQPDAIKRAQLPIDHRIAWIAPQADGSFLNVVNHICILHPQATYASASKAELTNECVKQEGGMLTFKNPWTYRGKGILIDASNKFDAIMAVNPSGLVLDTDKVVGDLLAKINDFKTSGNGSKGDDMFAEIKRTLDSIKVQEDSFWKAVAGAPVSMWNVEDPDVYVCNLHQSNGIVAVYGERKINDELFFSPIPKSYYKKDLNYNLTGVGHITTLSFYTSLLQYKGQGWTGNVWASVDSPLSNNPVEIIKWLLQTYSDYTIGPTFAAISSQLDKFENNFSLETNEDVIKVCEDLAWKNRLGLRFSNGQADIVYLSTKPSSVMTFTVDNTAFQSPEIFFSPTEEIRTHVKALWAESGRPLDKKINEQPTIYQDFNNTSLYGAVRLVKGRTYLTRHTVRTEKDMNTVDVHFNNFNCEDPVRWTTAFWLNRLSNSWRTIKLTTFMNGLILEPYDGVTVNIPALQASIVGVVTRTDYDIKTRLIHCEIWLPCPSGTVLEQTGTSVDQTVMTASKFGAWHSDSAYNTPDNPADALVETEYDIRVKHKPMPATKILHKVMKDIRVFARYSGAGP